VNIWKTGTRWHSKLWHSVPQPLGNRDAIWVCFAYRGAEVISLRRRSGSRVGYYQQGYSNQGFCAGRMGQVQRPIVIAICGCSSMIDLSYEELDTLFRVFSQCEGSHPSLSWHAPWFVRSFNFYSRAVERILAHRLAHDMDNGDLVRRGILVGWDLSAGLWVARVRLQAHLNVRYESWNVSYMIKFKLQVWSDRVLGSSWSFGLFWTELQRHCRLVNLQLAERNFWYQSGTIVLKST
jgi:hypothetical protein